MFIPDLGVGIIRESLVIQLIKSEFVEPFAVGTTAELESRQGRKREGRGKPAERAQPLLTNKR